MSSDASVYGKIQGFVETIKHKPKKDVKSFFFDEDTKFIVDGKKLKLLPIEYSHLSAKDEFYMYVNLREKVIRYYAYDIKDFIYNEKINTRIGIMEWTVSIEDSLHNFFVSNIKDLTEATFPFSQINTNIQPHAPLCRCDQCKPHQSPHQPTEYDRWKNTFDNSSYKEREAFYDKIWALQKIGRVSQAIDFIHETIDDMHKREKFSIIDDILRLITFDKLTIPAMINLAAATNGIEKLNDRKFFVGKVKDHIVKLKPTRANMILKGLDNTNKSN